MVKFEFCKVRQVPRDESAWANILSKLASTKPRETIKVWLKKLWRPFP